MGERAMKQYEGVTCRGSYKLGTACGKCERCTDEQNELLRLGPFKDHPVSIAEIKSGKSENAADWKPRDALVSLLREIDQGKHPNLDCMVICFRENHGEGRLSTKFRAAAPDPHSTIGLLHCVLAQCVAPV